MQVRTSKLWQVSQTKERIVILWQKKRKLERSILTEVHWRRGVQGGGGFLLAKLLGSRFLLRDIKYIFTTGACN